MIVKTFSVITNEVSKKQIWNLATDINNWKEWDSSVEYSCINGKFEAGNTFILKPKGGPKVKILIEEAQESSYYRDLTKFPLAKMYGEHFYEQIPEGVKITITMTMSGLLGRLWYRLVMKDIVDSLKEDINNQIKAAKNR